MGIVRFAPSPTNCNEDVNNRGLHVGGLRTALYNYVFAKQNGHHLICRIEDTDEARSNNDCLKCIVRDFEWAGIKFDAGYRLNELDELEEFNNTNRDLGPLRQSQRLGIYHKYIAQLIDDGWAYEKEGAVYFKMLKKEVVCRDRVAGRLKLPRKDCEDFVILKSSGMPSFYFAMTVDDHEMGVDFIIRGAEHINTLFRQSVLQDALDFNKPETAHIPLIMNPDGTKMSKRQASGQVNVYDFWKDGYLSEALINYIALLGWSTSDGREIFDIDFMIKDFNIDYMGRSNARFDDQKLKSMNKKAITAMPKDKLVDKFTEYSTVFHEDIIANLQADDQVEPLCEMAQDRAATLVDIVNQADYVLNAPKLANDTLTNDEVSILNMLYDVMHDCEWYPENIVEQIRLYSNVHDIDFGNIIRIVRLAITGKTITPPIDRVFDVLGKDTVLSRIMTVADKQFVSAF